MNLRDYLVNGGRIERDGNVTRLTIPPTTSAAYADAQLDDYDHASRVFVNVSPQGMHIRARFSHPASVLKGTAGFGFWNHPFTQEGNVIEPPTNLWFFYGSPESNMQVVRGLPGHGFKASALSSPLPLGEGRVRESVTHTIVSLGNLALRLPLISSLAIAAAQCIVTANEAPLNIDMMAWHDYALEWQHDKAVFKVDDVEVLRTTKSPHGPLGFVAWIDNYRATTADGRYEFGYVDVVEEQWVELRMQN